MKIFFGCPIQGHRTRGERSARYQEIIDTLVSEGCRVLSEHVTGKSTEEVAHMLEKSIGPLPPPGLQRIIYTRNKMIELLEGDIDGIIFEVSVPSTGTGVEIAHAYLRPRLGLKEVPILALYEKDFWPNNLSSMIKGLTPEVAQVQIS